MTIVEQLRWRFVLLAIDLGKSYRHSPRSYFSFFFTAQSCLRQCFLYVYLMIKLLPSGKRLCSSDSQHYLLQVLIKMKDHLRTYKQGVYDDLSKKLQETA